MSNLRQAAQQVLEALEKYRHMMFVEAGCRFGDGDAAIDAHPAASGEGQVMRGSAPAVRTSTSTPMASQGAKQMGELLGILNCAATFACCVWITASCVEREKNHG
jgi:hypothetical protein